MASSNDEIIGRVSVRVSPDLTRFYRDTKTKLDAVEARLKDLGVTFNADVELNKASKKHVEDQLDDLNAKIDAKVSEASARETQARMLFLSRDRIATIYPKVNELAAAKATRALAALTGTRSIKSMLKDVGEFIGELDRALPKFAAISTAVINLGASLMASTANLLSFGGSLASIGGAGLALPGIIGGLAVGVTAFAVSMKDFNKYVPNFAIGLGRATTAGAAWKHLQDTMSSRFWKTAAQPMRELVNTLFPQFSAGMNKVSGQLGIFTGHLADSFKGSLDGPMKNMFNDLQDSITVMSGHTDAFAGIIAKLGSVGAGNLPKLAGWFGDISDQFDNWLGRKQATGELQGFVDTGVTQLKALGVVLRETGSSLAGLARAAEKAGGTTLEGLATSMTHVSDTINGPTFQKAFTKAFRGADDAMRNIADRTGPAFESFMLRLTNVLGKGMPIAGDAAGRALQAIFSALDTNNVENSFLGLIQSLDTAVQKLAPTMPALAKAIAGVTRAGSALIESIAGTLAPIIENLGPKVSSLADDLLPVIKALGEGARVIATLGSGVLAAVPNSVLLLGTAYLALGRITGIVGTQLGKIKSVFVGTGNAARAQIPTLRQFGTALAFSMQPNDLLRNPGKYGKYGDYFKNGVGANALKAKAAVNSFAKSVAPAVGQAALLAVTATGLSEKMGITNTTTLALAGSFIGPWGTAIGAAIGSMLDMSKAAGDTDVALGAYADAMAKGTAAARDFALTQLEAQKAQLESMNFAQKFAAFATGKGVIANQIDDLRFKIADLKNEATAPSTNSSLMTMLIGPTGQLTGAMQQAAAATKAFDNNLKAMAGTLSRREAWRSYKDAIAAATAAAKQNGKTLNDNTSAGRSNNAMLDNIAAAAGRVNSTLKESGKARFLVQARADFVDAARKVSDNEGKIQHLATKIFGFGKIKASAKVGVEDTTKGGKGALPTLDEIFKKGKKLSNSSFKLFFRGNTQQVDKSMAGLTGKIAKFKRAKTQISITATAAPANKTINALQAKLRNAGKVKYKATFTIQDKTKAPLSGIQKGGKKTAAAITSAANGATKKLGSMPRQFSGVGSQSMAGLAGGIRGGQSGVVNAAAAVVSAAIAAARNRAQIRSPSRVFRKIGTFVSLGFANGIKGGQSTVISAMSTIIGKLAKHKGLKTYATNVRKRLLGMAKDWESLKNKISEVQTYVDGVTANISQIGSPVEINGGSFLDITENLKFAVKDAQAFATVLTKLRDLKLNKTTMDQLAQAGPEAALAAAQAIASSGKAGVDSINKLQGQLNSAASKAANSSADVVFNTGQNVAKGLLAGLKSSQKSIETMMVNIAKTMIKTIRRALKIKSPSRVFKEIGANTGKGFVHGVESQVSASEKAIKKLGAGRPGTSGRAGSLAMAGSSAVTKNLYYYAAPGSSISSEEDLFSAFNRARSVL